ncbi:MAG: hypothetical protein J6C55_04205 [Oscillospiraceae bacterium]|nr:hypothetical protein [Oscillospiraceae bacterium]
MRKKNNKYYKILIILSLSLIIIFIFILNSSSKNIFLKKQKNISEIISELPKRYQTELNISSNSGFIKGSMIRENNKVVFEIKEPVLLTGFQIIYDYDNKKILMKYKEIESKINNNLVIKNFPVSVVINIENLVYQGYYNNYNIEDDILYLEGQYEDDEFILKIDLRQNKIISILLKNNNIDASVAYN